jgi:PPM family protein phosphatase
MEIVGLTDRGKVRPHNEDAIVLRPESSLVALADGMGGHQAGEVASAMAVSLIGRDLHAAWCAARNSANSGVVAEKLVADHVRAANDAIYRKAQADPSCAGMGTTLTVGLFHSGSLTLGHVGDSRIYRLRAGELSRLTRDDTLVQDLIDAGLMTIEEGRASRQRHILTRALGLDPAVEYAIHTHACQPGDLYLFCSDGLTEMLDEQAIQRALVIATPDLSAKAALLVEAANELGGLDNISVILARTTDSPHEAAMK